MARAPNAAENGGENFVHHIVADPKNVPDVMMLYGYPGASSEEGHERLYLAADLSRYVEVPRTAILHREHASKEQDPHGGVTLWVKKDAALINKMAPAQQAAQQALAHYFAGALQGGAGAAQAMPGGPQTILPAACPPPRSVEVCTTPQCHVSVALPCPTHAATCFATCHATCVATCVATCQATCAATCQATCAATCPQHATCGATCVATCHATCAPVCTHVTPCVKTEVCTEVLPQCTHLAHCPLPQAAQAGMGAEAQYGCAYGTIHGSAQVVACSVACPTRYTCNVAVCWVTREAIACSELCPTRVTCNYECYITRNPAVCPIASAIACPPQSLGCPQQSLGCGGQGPVPFAGAGSFFGNHSCPGVCRPVTLECWQ